jgi:hypothetical protein
MPLYVNLGSPSLIVQGFSAKSYFVFVEKLSNGRDRL